MRWTPAEQGSSSGTSYDTLTPTLPDRSRDVFHSTISAQIMSFAFRPGKLSLRTSDPVRLKTAAGQVSKPKRCLAVEPNRSVTPGIMALRLAYLHNAWHEIMLGTEGKICSPHDNDNSRSGTTNFKHRTCLCTITDTGKRCVSFLRLNLRPNRDQCLPLHLGQRSARRLQAWRPASTCRAAPSCSKPECLLTVELTGNLEMHVWCR